MQSQVRHHHVHVMLDQQDRHAGRPNASDQIDQSLALGAIEAGGRFVEQQQFRLRDDGTCDLDKALRSVGQSSRLHIR